MKYHFVVLAEKKPTKWKKNSRYRANEGTEREGRVSPVPRRVHPTLVLTK